MSSNDSTARSLALSVLRSEPINEIDFVAGSTFITPRGYRRVAGYIECNRVAVKYDPGIVKDGDQGRYDNRKDTILLSSILDQPWNRQVVVHEATHCIHDSFGQNRLSVAASELDARIAQALFAQASGHAKPTNNELSMLAWNAAAAMRLGGRSWGDLKQKLFEAIIATPVYGRKLSGYNGIRED